MSKSSACRVILLAGILLWTPAMQFGQKKAAPKAPPPAAKKEAPAAKSAKAKAAKANPPSGAKVEATSAPMGVHFDMGDRRDPFFNYALLAKQAKESPDDEMPRGDPPPGIAGMLMSKVKLLGTATGEDNITAVFEGTDGRAYFLQEKDKLFDGYLKKIEADSVILIRETRLRSGKVITQEVVKRLRTP